MMELCPHMSWCLWISKYNFQELVLSLYYADLRDCLQIIRLGGKRLSPLCHLIGPGGKILGTIEFRKDP